MKLVFGIMSAVHSAATVNQLVEALAPHRVVIHHDFHQQPEFVVDQPNAVFVPEPKRTGWAIWGFSEGIFHLLRYCVEQEDCDYFQILSPTCLPIRPVSEFHEAMTKSTADAHADLLDMSQDDDALMNFGYRAFAANESLLFRVLKRCSLHYYGYEWTSRKQANLQLRSAPPDSRGRAARLCRAVTIMAARGWLGPHIFSERFRPFAGGSWFGARRDVCRYMLDCFDDPAVSSYFSRVHIADELLIATLLGNSDFRVEPSNHFVNEFTAGNPNWLNTLDLQMLKSSGKFFARKFPDDPSAAVRQAILAHAARREPADVT